MTATELRAEAARKETAREESFDRCDTDGFRSQHALQLGAERDRLNADILDNNGLWEFPALFDLKGNLVAAKLVHVYNRFSYREETTWAILENDDPSSRVTRWIKAFPARVSTMEKKGYREGRVMVPAVAVFAGKVTVCVIAVRRDKGFSRNVTIVDCGIPEVYAP